MSKTITQAIAGAHIGAKPELAGVDPKKTVKGLFMLFHGWYGNLFLSRYESGDKDATGKDRGTMSAMVIWQNALDRFDGDVVRAAACRCEADHPKYPPTLPEFLAICKATRPRAVAPESQFQIPMSDALKSANSAKARADAMATYHANVSASVDVVRPSEGLGLLHALIAKAVGLAGGNEAARLHRLEREAPPPKRFLASVASGCSP